MNRFVQGMKVTTGIKALILVPTAELCEQVYKVVDDLIVHCRHLVGHIYIGKNETAATEEHKLLLHPDIVIATPARLVQLLVSRVRDQFHSMPFFPSYFF